MMKRIFLLTGLCLLPFSACGPLYTLVSPCQDHPEQCPLPQLTQGPQSISLAQGGKLEVQLDRFLRYGEGVTARLVQTVPTGPILLEPKLYTHTEGYQDLTGLEDASGLYASKISAGELAAAGFVVGPAQWVVTYHTYDGKLTDLSSDVTIN